MPKSEQLPDGPRKIMSDIFVKGKDPRRTGSSLSEWLSGILERDEREGSGGRPHLWGSDAGFCARRIWLLAMSPEFEEKIVGSGGRGYMAIGVAFEDLLVSALKKEGRFLAGQFRSVPLDDLEISSKFDAVVLDAEDRVMLLEIKTCGKLPEAPRPTHLAQIQTYAAVSGFRNASLVYMSRELMPRRPIAVRTFQVDTSDEALQHRLEIAELSRLAIEAGAAPPQPAYFRKSEECRYCEFRGRYCYGADGGLIEMEGEELLTLKETAATLAKAHIARCREREIANLKVLAESGLLTTKQIRAVRKAAAGATT